MTILTSVACSAGASEVDAAAERAYLQAFCTMADRQNDALAPYDDDAAAILAHLPVAVQESLQTLKGLEVPPTFAPFHDMWVEIYTLALQQDLEGVTATGPEDAIRLFLEGPVRQVAGKREVRGEVRERMARLALDVPECGESFAVGLGYATPSPD